MFNRAAALVGSGVTPAKLVNTWTGYSFKPRDMGLQRGDMIVIPMTGLMSPNDSWQSFGAVMTKVLAGGDLDKTYAHYQGGIDNHFIEAVFLRDARSLVPRGQTGIKKSPNHAGLLIVTAIDPRSLISGPPVTVNGISLPSSAHYYDPPENGVSINVHLYLYPQRPLFPDNGTITVPTQNPTYPPSWGVLEILGA